MKKIRFYSQANWLLAVATSLSGCGNSTANEAVEPPMQASMPPSSTTAAEVPNTLPAPSASLTTPAAPIPALPPSKCTPPALVCEDFEEGAIHTNVWTMRAPNGLLEVVQDRVAHGKYAMHTNTNQNSNSQAELVETAFLGGNFFGRMNVYFPIKPRNAHASLFSGIGNDQGNYTGMSISVGRNLFIGYGRDNPFFDTGSNAQVTVPVGRWFCIEWNLRPVEGSNNHLWIDGVEVASFLFGDKFSNGSLGPTGDGTFRIPPFTEARVGWSHTSHNDPDPFTDVWFDDIALGPERIGCVPP